jgi:hypothetical protein
MRQVKRTYTFTEKEKRVFFESIGLVHLLVRKIILRVRWTRRTCFFINSTNMQARWTR